MKISIILLLVIASINTINTESRSDERIQLNERSISKTLNYIREGFAKKIQIYSQIFLKAFQRPKANTNRHVCLWKICSKPLKSAVKNGQQNILKTHKKKMSAESRTEKTQQERRRILARYFLGGF